MRHQIIALSILAFSATATLQARAQVSVGVNIGLPGINIGINMPAYPRMVAVPGYPVYYDPRGSHNYFFYDSLYWVYQGNNWYASSWYNGPWDLIGPAYVPLFVLRVPVRYYRQPPGHFRGWAPNTPPRWGEHWGRDWEDKRRGWDRWDKRSAPPAAPLPSYQQNYSGERYPRGEEQQQALRSSNYRYQPREEVSRQYAQQRGRNADFRGDRPDGPQGGPQYQQPENGSPREQAMRERQQQEDRSAPMPPSMQGNQDAQQGMGRPDRSPPSGRGRDDQREFQGDYQRDYQREAPRGGAPNGNGNKENRGRGRE